jgi:hypothetical protein
VSARTIARVGLLLAWLPVVIYGLITAQQFFHTANSAVFLSTDDAVGNISYALATEGRYGFLSSPLLAGMARHDGLFSYGPFYFYLGAGLIWRSSSALPSPAACGSVAARPVHWAR